MKFPLSAIRPNPHRNIEHYPIREDKIAALRESVRSTTFWDNLVARLRPDGGAEIAYGHHRLVALRQEYGPDFEITLIIRDLDDAQMLKIMARENMQEWDTSALVEQETVAAVVKAYAEDKIKLRSVPLSGRGRGGVNPDQIRYAPRFGFGFGEVGSQSHPYTAKTVAEFLGWLEPKGKDSGKVRAADKVHAALHALALIETSTLTLADFRDLTSMQGRAVVDQTRLAAPEDREAARIAQDRAKVAREEAEKAERERAEAERLAEEAREEARQAEIERLEAEAEEHAQAKAEERRRLAEEREAAAQLQAEEAERRKVEAEARRQAQEAERQHAQARWQSKARHVGGEVARGMRARKGVNNAAEIAEKALPRPASPPEINRKAAMFAANLARVLVNDKDVELLDALWTHREHLKADTRRQLVDALTGLADRAATYRDLWAGRTPTTTADPAGGDDLGTIDAEVVDEMESVNE